MNWRLFQLLIRIKEAINGAIHKLAQTKTIVVIAHREASLRACQRIIALHPTDSYSNQSNASEDSERPFAVRAG